MALLVQPPGLPPLLSNELPLALAPIVTLSPLSAAAGDLVLNLTCMPRVRDGQRVFLLFGDRLLAPQSISNPADIHQPTALVFQVPDVASAPTRYACAWMAPTASRSTSVAAYRCSPATSRWS